MDFLGILRGVIFSSLMMLAAAAACVFASPSLFLTPVPSRRVCLMRRMFNTMILGQFSMFAGLLIRTLYGTSVFIYCDDLRILEEQNDKVLIMSNHRTRIDWMFIIWVYGAVTRKVSNMVVILKNDLKSIPFIGWCMQLYLYIFLQRKKKHDIPHIRKLLYHIMSLVTDTVSNKKKRLMSLLIFPEGTDLSEQNVMKSNEYAKQKKLKSYSYVLHPKSIGITTALQCFRERDSAACSEGEGSVLHDLTLAYEDHTPGDRPSELSLFTGNFPHAVHIHVKRHEVSSLPTDPEEISKWVQDSFAEKEELLREFYSSTRDTVAVPCKLKSWPQLVSHPLSPNQCSFSRFSCPFLFMFSMIVIWALGILHFKSFQYYSVFCYAVYALCAHLDCLGGLDKIELGLHSKEKLE